MVASTDWKIFKKKKSLEVWSLTISLLVLASLCKSICLYTGVVA